MQHADFCLVVYRFELAQLVLAAQMWILAVSDQFIPPPSWLASHMHFMILTKSLAAFLFCSPDMLHLPTHCLATTLQGFALRNNVF